MADDTLPVVQETKHDLPIPFEEMDADAELGGKVSMRDLSIPYLYILQGLSPQCQPASPKFIRGAGVSMLYMTVANTLFPAETGLSIVSCFYERVVNEWKPRASGGGLVTTHNPESGILEKGKAIDPKKPAELYLPNGNLIVDTAYHYILVKREQRYSPTVFPLKSTMLKHSRNWNSNLNDILIPGTAKHAPRWLYEWQVTSIAETKNDNIWYVPNFKQGLMVSREVYAQAKEYAKIAATGALRRPMEDWEQTAGEMHSESADSPI